jgi:chorismate mutase
MSKVRGIRGATTVSKNEEKAILEVTRELLVTMVEANNVSVDDIASAIFTVTQDLDATFPAAAARELGWKYVPLMCSTEIPVKESLPMCIRVLLHVNTSRSQEDIKHIYLNEAFKLRPDLSKTD